MRRPLITAAALLLLPLTASAQDETSLRKFFEGRSVTVRIEMPATSGGIEIQPGADLPLSFPDLAKHIKEHGVGIHQGESVMVTKVHIKGDHIEFQLGGGGFGTFGDALAMAAKGGTASYQGKSDHEKDLEQQVKRETNPDRRTRLRRELSDLQRERRRDNNAASAQNLVAKQSAEQDEADARARSGSRFNIKYRGGYPAGALTPDGVMAALAEYVEFPWVGGAVAAAPSPAADEPVAVAAAPTTLRKGLTVSQVEALLGSARTASTEDQGGLEVATREYSSDGNRVVTKFVGGVLVDYTIAPEG
jgi:hypothetical protein